MLRHPSFCGTVSTALCEDRLAVVIGEVGSFAKQACVPVTAWFSDEVFGSNALVPLQPFRWGELLEFRPEHEIQFSPDLVQLSSAGDLQNGMVNRCDERVIQFWIS